MGPTMSVGKSGDGTNIHDAHVSHVIVTISVPHRRINRSWGNLDLVRHEFVTLDMWSCILEV